MAGTIKSVDEIKVIRIGENTAEAARQADIAAGYAADAQAYAAALNISTQALPDIIETDQDAEGRWWVQKWADGTTRIQKPCDVDGNRLDDQIAALGTRTDALEASEALNPPIQRRRLKKALYNSGGLERQVSAVDPIVVGAWGDNATTMTSPVTIGHADARVRLFGGRWQEGVGFPGNQSMYGQANTNGDLSAVGVGGLPANRFSNDGDLDFMLPAGQTVFELKMMGQGGLGNFFVDIDGVGTNADGYVAPPAGTGHIYYIPITLPASTNPRRVRISIPNRPFTGLNVETGGTIAAYTPPVGATMAFLGDSITQGSVSTGIEKKWERIVARKLGIDNAVNLGIGGSGYLIRLPDDTDPDPGYNFLDRIDDVLTGINGGPPDAVVIAGGINDFGVDGSGPYTAAEIGAQALLLFQQLRAAAPDMCIFVVGPFCGYTSTDYVALAECRDAIFAAAGQVARCHTIDIEGMATLANRDTIWNGTVNGPHPLDAGHAIYADFISAAVAAIINTY